MLDRFWYSFASSSIAPSILFPAISEKTPSRQFGAVSKTIGSFLIQHLKNLQVALAYDKLIREVFLPQPVAEGGTHGQEA